MDEFIDPFLSVTSWSDICASPGRPSWTATVSSHANTFLGNSILENDEKGSNASLIPPNDIIGDITSDGSDFQRHHDSSSLFINGNLKYGIDKGLFPTEHQLQSQGMLVNNSDASLFCTKLNSQCAVTLPQSALTDLGSFESSNSELSAFPQSFGDASSISSASIMWPPLYSGASSLIMEQGKLQGFGSQEFESDADVFKKDPSMLCSPQLHSFATGQQMKMPRLDGSQTHNQQLMQPIEVENIHNYPVPSSSALSEFTQINGVTKPRVRARRGQATDPHSIAERLRREKIADRMKNLQELVPNSNKADKASMLDEIIDYVKFLQLQVKVLSMSRLGAAGAVVPLITDAHSEICGGALSVGHVASESPDSQDSLAFEQEVVKMMESNVTTAMQYLQNNGLCMMPVALASIISSQKGSITSTIPPPERKNQGTKADAVASWKGRGSVEANGRAEGGPFGYNGAAVKQEDSPNKSMGSSSSSSTR